MKVFLSGLGSIGMRHAKNLISLGVSDILAADPDESQRGRASQELGLAVVPDFDAVRSFRPDLTVVCSPTAMHIAQAKIAAETGSHLFIEKPIGTDIADATLLMEEVTRRNLFAHVGSNWKFHPAFQGMKKLITDGTIGRVVSAQAKFGWWLPEWRPGRDYRQTYAAKRSQGGGTLNDNHELDLLSWLLGPIDDWCGFKESCPELETDVDDVSALVLRFGSGALATLSLDYMDRVYTRWYHVTGTLGSFSWNYADSAIMVRRRSPEAEVRINVISLDLNDMFVAQMRHVLAGVKGEAEPITPIHAAIQIMRVQQSRNRIREARATSAEEI